MVLCTARMLRIVLIIVGLPVIAWAAGYESGNILSNGGFEKGDFSEAANDALGLYPWLTGNSGGNAIAATGKKTRGGAFSLEWSPIGWNVKDRPFYMGFTPFPPDITPEAIGRTYKGIAANADIICHHFDDGVPWPEALEGKLFSKHLTDGWNTRRDNTPANFKVFVAVTPLNAFRKGMALYHGEKDNMPLPKAFENRAFDDPEIMKAYLQYCRRTVTYFKPDYLAIGIEVNELVHNSPEKWPGFVTLYKHVYSRLKMDYPQMPIFATFTLHNMLQEGWSDIELQREKVREFLTEVDIVGISFYPFMKTLGAPERPFEAFDWIREFVGDKPIAITETGFPAEPTHLKDFNVTLPGGEQSQAAYIESVLSAAGRDRYLFVIAFLYQDYDALWEKIKGSFSGDWAAAWRDCGLIDGDGKERPAHEVWRKYVRAKYLRK